MEMIKSLSEITDASPYQSYVYAYPHKTAYRPFDSPIPLKDIWVDEDKSSLFLYIHIPFCEMRCGFCNLFTTVHPTDSLESAYLDQLEIQAQRTKAAIGSGQFARMAIGGGTPTYLTPEQLHRVFAIAEDVMEARLANIPISVETSPLTATLDRLAVLRNHHVERISIGVQSFIESEVRAAGRAQKTENVHHALENIRAAQIPTLNIDLMYGLPGQTVDSWMTSLRTALMYAPEELYVYPLYVRPLTGLGKNTVDDPKIEDIRLACYRAGRDLLLAQGYQQISMRMFRVGNADRKNGVQYCCQEDGMIGLGCGARSYTRHYHYATEYAVGRRGVLAILQDYIQRDASAFDHVDYGFHLNDDDQRRRYILKSLLHETGLSLPQYRAYFGTDALEDYPELKQLAQAGFFEWMDETLHITDQGLEASDAIGPYLYSDFVQVLMKEYDLR